MRRRRFLKSLAVAGAGTLLPAHTLLAQAPAARRLVDVHHHVLPPEFVKATVGRFVNPAVVERWSLARALEEMDESGVALAIASITQPGVSFGDRDAAVTLARTCNEYMARVAADRPGRFGFFAVLPLPDADASLREAAYALDTLKADGIGVMTSIGDKWLGDPVYAPLFDELNRRRAVVYVHPNAAQCCTSLMPDVTPNMIEYPHDTARAIVNLLLSGTLARLREVRFIFSHAGGTLPMVAGRIAQLVTPAERAKVPNGVEAELQRLYFEIANAAHRPAIAALTSMVPRTQILFGTDYPFVPVRATAEGMRRVGLTADDLRAIEFANAAALLPRAR